MELNNLAYKDVYKPIMNELSNLMKDWQVIANDTVPLKVNKTLPLNYDHTQLVRKPDAHQPEYTLNKYFRKEQ